MIELKEKLSGMGNVFEILSAKSLKTPFQEIVVAQSSSVGKILVLDGAVQLTEEDEANYHEMLLCVPAVTLGSVEKVLIIGGGDGGSAREALRFAERIDVVEIDAQVVNVCKEEFPEIASAFDDDRVNLIFDDGAEFIKDKTDEYDLIIVDSSDPKGPSEVLFSVEFFQNAKKALKENGIFCTQSGSPFLMKDEFAKTVKNLSNVFSEEGNVVRPYFAFIPSYPSGMWSFTLASKKFDPLALTPQVVSERAKKAVSRTKRPFKYYGVEIHFAAFALPTFVRKMF